jgi:hypothetical protein
MPCINTMLAAGGSKIAVYRLKCSDCGLIGVEAAE